MQSFSFWRSLASFRVRIALNLKGLSADVVDVNLIQGQQREEAFRKVNPRMLLPALIDGDGPPLFQSLAIIKSLDETHPHPRLLLAEPRARARARALAMIVAANAYPLIVPRVRDYFEHDLKLDEATRNTWIHHWLGEALKANLSASPETGRYCQGDAITVADICLVSDATDAISSGSISRRIVDTCMQNEAFARAHPLRQRGAPQPG